MACGFTGKILRIDLTTRSVEILSPDETFYRRYLGGGTVGTYFLLKEGAATADPLTPQNVLTIAAGVTTGAAVSGVSRVCLTALSPITGMIGDSQAGGWLGPYLKRAGYDAIVISGRAESLSYLYIDSTTVEIRPAAQLAGKTVMAAHEVLSGELGGKSLSILQCGPAGEKLVRFAGASVDLNNLAGRTGMGAVLGSKNLRAVAIRGGAKIAFADEPKLKALQRKARRRLPEVGFLTAVHKHGTPGLVAIQGSVGNMATHNHSRTYDERYLQLDGSAIEPQLAAGMTTCYGCVICCRKKVKAAKPYPLTDKIGGPEFETLGLLGSNLDIFDVEAVSYANRLCHDHGLDTLTMGGLAAYVYESAERGLIPAGELGGKSFRFGDPEGLLWLIEQVARKEEGIGAVLAEGFTAAIERYGEETRPYAVHVKNQGLAVHMPQVKPSQALMYAVCPIGPDHQSSEHDWLITADGEESRGLGILDVDTVASTNLAKVRMTVYSQYYYSLLDSLGLCMFCWAPGSLFSYRDLEDLVRSCTSWEITFWELMKAGERRVNLMRQVNALRGASKEQDVLPERLSEPVPDGPKQGSRVAPEDFAFMRDTYYQLMGWDPATGNPGESKLRELGLDWCLSGSSEEFTAEGAEDAEKISICQQ